MAAPATSGRKNPRRQPSSDADTFYFAYGSNLHLAQMAKRCPGSIFVGKATLSGYRWQINERGVANVVECTPPDTASVEGLVYRVNRRDEKSLDRSEGVSKGFYSQHLLEVTLERHGLYCDVETRRVARMFEEQGAPQDQSAGTEPHRSGDNTRKPTRGHAAGRGKSPSNDFHEEGPQRAKAIVYVSKSYFADGYIRDEYVARLCNAISDAVALGVSRSFVDEYMVPGLTRRHVAPASPIPKPGIANATGHREPDDMDIDQGGQIGSTSHLRGRESHKVDLHGLKSENRGHYAGSGLGLPARMLGPMSKTGQGTSGVERDTIYVVVVEEHTPLSDTHTGTSIGVTTRDLELANELALKCFREAHHRVFGLQENSLGRWVHSGEEGDAQSGDMGWELDNDACLHLDATRPEIESRVRVWVQAESVLIRS